MKTSTKRFLFWTPRIICILFACFISIFALDVFQENHGFWNTLLALLIHLIPTGLLLLILALGMGWSPVFLSPGRRVFHRLLGKIPLVGLRNYCRSAVSFGRTVPAGLDQARSCSRHNMNAITVPATSVAWPCATSSPP